jgi:uncharacterized protein with LGFP repeats
MARRGAGTQARDGGISRRSLITTSAGVATTAAVAAVGPAAAIGLLEAPAVAVAAPSTHTPADPVVAYVRDAARGEVTVISGQCERTFRDVALVKRLLAAGACASGNGGK